MTIREMIAELRTTLSPAVGESEARAMADVIIEDIKDYSPTQRIVYDYRELSPDTVAKIRAIARKVAEGNPLQYALGLARWHGRKFAVTPDVLIPRPETSQLVDMIVDRNLDRRDLRVLDIGTGSGCIAITLAIDLPFAQVDAIDISAPALRVAKDNAAYLKALVNFYHADAFGLADNPEMRCRSYDIIVSNPPYIFESERPTMDTRVSEHEPNQALFVADDAPIAIYQSIAEYARKALTHAGQLYFEINPLCAKQLCAMLTKMGFDDVVCANDYQGIKRFISCSL